MSAEVVGLVPCAGIASRLGSIPCSKEIYPIGFREACGRRPRVVTGAEVLLEKFRAAGARRAYVILRQGKWDIPTFLGDGARIGMSLGYLIMRLPFGHPFTIDAATPFVREANVVFGFPDILFDSEDAFVRLLKKQQTTEADVVLGVFRARRPEKMDMVALDRRGRVQDIVIKPERTRLHYTWIIAAWTPTFTRFLHEFVANRLPTAEAVSAEDGRELYMGDVIQAALDVGMEIETVAFQDAMSIDIGTPADLTQAVRFGFVTKARSIPTEDGGRCR